MDYFELDKIYQEYKREWRKALTGHESPAKMKELSLILFEELVSDLLERKSVSQNIDD